MIPTSQGPMSAESIIDHLSYSCYAHNRRTSPNITPEQWAKCWPGAEALEARFQADLAIAKAAA